MTQKEAIIKVLKELGGRAKLTDIYPRVIIFVEPKERRAGGNLLPIRRRLSAEMRRLRDSRQK